MKPMYAESGLVHRRGERFMVVGNKDAVRWAVTQLRIQATFVNEH